MLRWPELLMGAILSLLIAAGVAAGPPAAPDDVLAKVAAAVDDVYLGPAWVPAEAVSGNGQLQTPEIFGETGLAALKAKSMRPDRLSKEERAQFPLELDLAVGKVTGLVSCDCPIVNVFPSGAEPLPHSTVPEIVESADDVLVGTIADVALGFSFATAGTLLRVEVDQSLKNSVSYGSLDTVYVFYPHAEFAVDGHLFCNQGWFGPQQPKRGDRVIVTPFGGWDAQGVPIVHAVWWELPLFVSSSRVVHSDTLDPEEARAWAADRGLLSTRQSRSPGDENRRRYEWSPPPRSWRLCHRRWVPRKHFHTCGCR